jgi:general secretion pathway protein E
VLNFIEHLRGRGLVTEDQSVRIAREVSLGSESVVHAIVRLGFIDQQALAAELSDCFGIAQIADTDWPHDAVLPDRISPRFMRENLVLPLWADQTSMTVAIADPAATETLHGLRVASERTLDLRIATASQIASRVERLLEGGSASGPQNAVQQVGEAQGDDEQIKDLALDAPVINLVNRLFREASAARATDLHIEPSRGRVVVRRRVDGMLQEADVLQPSIGRAAVSRIKILTQLNIAERRLPQDGRARLSVTGREFDIRVATMPTIHGESIAIRFLSATNQVPDIANIGLAEAKREELKRQASHAHGLVIVTGPTGSGKTTTLAAVLSFLNDPSRKILTIEDPVEYQVEGVNQIQVRPDIGLTFATTLRSMLRVDPDIIMVGEMRDRETASIGVNAALTGHLVLTTLHTNSAAGAITRLLDLGVPAFLIASTLRCVVAQRLLRKLCITCREPYTASPQVLERLGTGLASMHKKNLTLWKPVGCEHCNHSGYLGRVAIFEVLVIDDAVRKHINTDASSGEIAGEAHAGGSETMLADGVVKCLEGITTLEELARVVSED